MKYPKTNAACRKYAAGLTKLHGKKYTPVRLPQGNRFGLTHAAATDADLPELMAAGAMDLTNEPAQP